MTDATNDSMEKMPLYNHYEKEFEQTGNAVFAMAAFCRARSDGEPIPETILQFLEDTFLEWGNEENKHSLDTIMKLKPGTGAKSALDKLLTEQRNRDIFYTMAVLIGLGWSKVKASEAACCYVNQPKYNEKFRISNAGRGRDAEEVLTPETIRKYWGSKEIERREAEKRALWPLNCWSETQKKDYLVKCERLIYPDKHGN